MQATVNVQSAHECDQLHQQDPSWHACHCSQAPAVATVTTITAAVTVAKVARAGQALCPAQPFGRLAGVTGVGITAGWSRRERPEAFLGWLLQFQNIRTKFLASKR